MKRSTKTIISCALTGSVHTPSMSPGLPVTANVEAGGGQFLVILATSHR